MSRADTPKSRGLLGSGILVSAMSLISRFFGLTRDIVFAWFFGSSPGAAAFFVAFRIPNFLRRLFAEGAFSAAFIPVLSEYRAQRDQQEVRHLVNSVMGSLGLVLLLVSLAGVLAAPGLVAIFAPGFAFAEDSRQFWLATDMLRITFPYLLLISLTALSAATLNNYGVFGPPAFTPVLLNLCLIGAAVFLSNRFAVPVHALAWGVLVAGLLQLLFQLPFLHRLSLLPRPWPRLRDPGVRRVMLLMLPAVFGVSVAQINVLIDTALASLLETGSIPWLYYSHRLSELPLALVGISLGTVILPNLAGHHARGSKEAFVRTLAWALRLVLYIGLPATAALLFLADESIAGIFFGGEFTRRDVAMASMSLQAYAAGLLGHMLVKVLAPAFFAQHDTSTPVRVGIVAMLTNILFNLLLVWFLGHVGLALATSLSAFVNAGLLLFYLTRQKLVKVALGQLALEVLRVLLGTAGMLLALYWATSPLDEWFVWPLWYRLTVLSGLGALGFGVYALIMVLAGVRLEHIRR